MWSRVGCSSPHDFCFLFQVHVYTNVQKGTLHEGKTFVTHFILYFVCISWGSRSKSPFLWFSQNVLIFAATCYNKCIYLYFYGLYFTRYDKNNIKKYCLEHHNDTQGTNWQDRSHFSQQCTDVNQLIPMWWDIPIQPTKQAGKHPFVRPIVVTNLL